MIERWTQYFARSLISSLRFCGAIRSNHPIVYSERVQSSIACRLAVVAMGTSINRSILSVGFGMIGNMLEYKSVEAGGFYVESPTRKLKPSQRCAKCWELTPKTLSDRVHVCSNPQCGHIEDRDINAAQVNLIWARGQELASLVAESARSTSCGSMKQLAAKKRQKLLAQRSSKE